MLILRYLSISFRLPPEKRQEIIRQPGSQADGAAGEGLGACDLKGMESGAGKQAGKGRLTGGGMIQRIPQERMTDAAHVDADLVGMAGFDPYF